MRRAAGDADRGQETIVERHRDGDEDDRDQVQRIGSHPVRQQLRDLFFAGGDLVARSPECCCAEDGAVKVLNVEAPGEFRVTTAEAMLEAIKA